MALKIEFLLELPSLSQIRYDTLIFRPAIFVETGGGGEIKLMPKKLISGHLEGEETEMEAAYRETREESGLLQEHLRLIKGSQIPLEVNMR